MPCEDNCCGTGSNAGSFPVPGDPDLNNSVLTAVSMLHGIRIKWTYPSTLDHALAYTNVFRSTVAIQGTESRIEQVSASYYDDLIEETDNSTYYYWISFVSVNGTEGDLIGPVSGTRQPTAARMLELLEGQISNTQLAQTLRDPIGQVPSIASDLSDEIDDRIAEISSYNIAIQQAINDSSDAYNYADQVNQQYQTAISASQSRLDSFISGTGSEYSAFEQMILLNVDGGLDEPAIQGLIDTTLSSERQNLFGTTDTAVINDRWDTLLTASEIQTSIDTVLVSERQAMFGTADRAAINTRWDTLLTDSEATASINTSLAAERTSLFGTSNASTINSKWNTLQSDSQVSSSINTALSSERTNIFGTTSVATINSRWDTLITQDEASAQFTTVLDVNGVLGGYGIHNDGVEVTTLFDVDKFVIGRTNGTLIDLAFAVDNGKVVMNGTHIQDATITDAAIDSLDVNKITGLTAVLDALEVEFARITGNIQSDSFVSGSTGWNVDRNGSAEFNDITIYDGNGNLAFASGQTYITEGSRARTYGLGANPDMTIVGEGGKPASYRLKTLDDSYINYADADKTILQIGKAGENNGMALYLPAIYVTPGASYIMRARVRRVNGVSGSNINLRAAERDSVLPDGAKYVMFGATGLRADEAVSSSWAHTDGTILSVNNSWYELEGVYTPSASVKFFSPWISISNELIDIEYLEVFDASFGNQAGAVAYLDEVNGTYIADAAITEAKIGTAAVDTLKIAGGAVTATHLSSDTVGDSNAYYSEYFGYFDITSFVFNHGHSSTIPCLINMNITPIDPEKRWQVRIVMDGVVKITYPINQIKDTYALDVPPGDHTIQVQMNGITSGVPARWLGYEPYVVYMFGAKR